MGSKDPRSLDFRPTLDEFEASFTVISSFVRRLRGASAAEEEDSVPRALLQEALADGLGWPRADREAISATLHVLTDLRLQGWDLTVKGKTIRITAPGRALDVPAEKERVRRQEHLKRDEQLATPAVRRFVRDLERRRLHGDEFVSVFSLMRDGREIAAKLRGAAELNGEARVEALGEIIDPYMVFVTDDAVCPTTGIRLMDVWRYFRHTWANQYTSVPGRSMMFLVRDRAAPAHPIIGIGAISSPVVQIRERDAWIGWHPEVFIEQLREAPTARIGRWLLSVVATALEEVFIQDLLEDDTCPLTPATLRHPTPEVIGALREEAAHHRELHHADPTPAEFKSSVNVDALEDAHWEKRARTHLYRSKRSLALADLLEARLTLNEFLPERPRAADVAALVADKRGARAVQRIVRRAKSERVGVAMSDISVCGAVAPYGPLLGGKLVSMLAASPEVVAAYKARYGGAVSEIASASAGRAIQRPAHLAFLGTTSLFGPSSQYNRVRVPADILGGDKGDEIRFRDLGVSESYGTSQFSGPTLEAFKKLLTARGGTRRVNYIFGEGTSPKLRQTRDALDRIGFPPTDLLRHGRHRVVYGISLVRNLRDFLLGIDERPRYLFKTTGRKATEAIAGWWRTRWLDRRALSAAVLDRVAEHTLTFPMRHGARVELPPEDPNQLTLFDDEL